MISIIILGQEMQSYILSIGHPEVKRGTQWGVGISLFTREQSFGESKEKRMTLYLSFVLA